jgi:SPP1 gp7 family putative phage head morphogenesis protein
VISLSEVKLRRMFTGQHVRPQRRRPLPLQAQPNTVRLAYLHALGAVIGRAHELVDEQLVPKLPELVAAAALVHDAPSDYPMLVGGLVDGITEEFLEEFPTERLTRLAAQFADRTSRQQREELNKQLHACLGIDLWAEPQLGAKLETWAAANAELVTSVSEKYFVEIKNATLQGLRSGQRAEDVAELLQERFDVCETRAVLIARDQVSKLHGELNRARQTEVGLEEYVWRTVGDERVRDSHDAREGRTFRWDAPPVDGHPGEPINCRCTAEPKLDALLEQL